LPLTLRPLRTLAANADIIRQKTLGPWTTEAATSRLRWLASILDVYFAYTCEMLSQSKNTCTTMIGKRMVLFSLDEVNHDRPITARAVIASHIFHYRPGQ
jgi:hypothetical protein